MAYILDFKTPTSLNIKRIVREIDEKIINEILFSNKPKHEIIHFVRKRSKEIRDILRLLRPKHEYIYKKENIWYRDAARDIAFIRDLQSITEATNRLFKHYKNELKEESYLFIYEHLVTKRDTVYNDEKKLNEYLNPFLKKIETAHGRINFWSIKNSNFRTIKKGLLKTYGRGKKDFTIAYKNPNTENFHDWRKRVKYHWCHLRLISSIWPEIIDANIAEFEQLAEILGDEHDLAVLKEFLLKAEWKENETPDIKIFFKYIDKRRTELREIAFPIGKKLFFEKQKSLSQRLEYYWSVKQKELVF